MYSVLASAALSALYYTNRAAASTVSKCPTDNVCYQVGVPSSSASSDSGNIYFQLKAPTSYTWVALGTGNRMSGSNIFVLYTDGNGNVTISPRTGTGHVQPESNTQTKLELLEGSGVVDNGDTMLANVRCSNCNSWSGGSMSLSSTNSDWIAAWKSGSSLDSADIDASISQHDSQDSFTLDLSQAVITSDANPFVGDSSSDTGTGTGTDSGSNTGSSSGDADSSEGVGNGGAPWYIKQIPSIKNAHGIIMAIVMVILYPIGSLLMPLTGKWLLHAVWQFIAFLAMWAGFGLGVVLTRRTGYDFHPSHTTFGTALVALFALQPIGGYLHHLHYVKHQTRGAVSHIHIWYGRALMLMGIINGGLGLRLAAASRTFMIAYGVVAAILLVVYGIGAVYGSVKRSRSSADRRRDVGPDRHLKRDGSS
ncbi:iron reductase domain protein [Xylariaceae sp. FL0016]|nr:iron reductase domain protein [Xylariaceae sp. FL0016]